MVLFLFRLFVVGSLGGSVSVTCFKLGFDICLFSSRFYLRGIFWVVCFGVTLFFRLVGCSGWRRCLVLFFRICRIVTTSCRLYWKVCGYSCF